MKGKCYHNKIEKVSSKMRRDLFSFVVFGLVIFLFSSLLSLCAGCSKKEDMEIVYSDFSATFYISENSNMFPFVFACNNQIDNIDITRIDATDEDRFTWEFIEEKDDNDRPLKFEGYYIYGFIFYIETGDDFIWDSFSLEINKEFYETIELNIEIANIDLHNEMDDIRALSIPYVITSDVRSAEWAYLAMNDINITSIKLYTSSIETGNIMFNSVLFSDEVYVEKLERFYIKIEFNESAISCFEKSYMVIEYYKDGEMFTYCSDYTIFGSQSELIYYKLLMR